jgi:DNA-binding CsgD family transcriptional regulator
MSELAQVVDLINDIYAAALDASLWPQTLRRAMSLLEGASAAIFSDSRLPADRFYCSVDVDPQYADAYVRHYVKMNPLIPFEERLAAGTVFSASDGVPYEELQGSPFFNEWARPQGFCDFIGAVLEKSPGNLTKLMVNRDASRGPVDERARDLMRLLAPHFQRAAAIGKALERSESKAAALGDVLDRLSTAVAFVDRAGRLVHANAAAERRLAEGEALGWSGGKPRPCSDEAAAHLQAILTPSARGAPAVSSCALSVTQTTHAGERVTVHVLPLSAASRRHGLAPCAAAAAIVVARCDADLIQRIESAARLYEFTPAEARVVQALLSGCTIGRVAALLGIAEATVKTHLQHVFDKTGTRRQVDLARLIVDRP